MNCSLELRPMSKQEAIEWDLSRDSLAPTLTERDQMNRSLDVGCLILAPHKEQQIVGQ